MATALQTYKALRKQQYSKSEAMERVLHFAKKTPRIQKKLIEQMLRSK